MGLTPGPTGPRLSASGRPAPPIAATLIPDGQPDLDAGIYSSEEYSTTSLILGVSHGADISGIVDAPLTLPTRAGTRRPERRIADPVADTHRVTVSRSRPTEREPRAATAEAGRVTSHGPPPLLALERDRGHRACESNPDRRGRPCRDRDGSGLDRSHLQRDDENL